jgi:hypothetical protein
MTSEAVDWIRFMTGSSRELLWTHWLPFGCCNRRPDISSPAESVSAVFCRSQTRSNVSDYENYDLVHFCACVIFLPFATNEEHQPMARPQLSGPHCAVCMYIYVHICMYVYNWSLQLSTHGSLSGDRGSTLGPYISCLLSASRHIPRK